jgi:hypothetical protein
VFGCPRVVFLILSFHFVNKNLVSFKFYIVIILLTLGAHTHLLCVRSHFNFSNMLVVNYLCHMWHKYYFLCNYLITLFNPFQCIFIRSFDVLIMLSLLDNNIYIFRCYIITLLF